MNHTLMTSTVVMLLALGLTACGEKTTTEKATDAAKTTGTAVGDAASGNDRYVSDRVNNGRDERKCGSGSAMSAGFGSLRDDEFRTLACCRSCLRNGLNLGNQRNAGSFYLRSE